MKVGQRTLDKDRQEEGVYIVSVAPLVSGLMVLAALLYTVTQGWGTLVALVCALVALWGGLGATATSNQGFH